MRVCKWTLMLSMLSPLAAQTKTTGALAFRGREHWRGYKCVLESDPSTFKRKTRLDARGSARFGLLMPGVWKLAITSDRENATRTWVAHVVAGEQTSIELDERLPFPRLLPPPTIGLHVSKAEPPLPVPLPAIFRQTPGVTIHQLPDSLPIPKGRVSLCVFPDHSFRSINVPEILAGLFNDTDADLRLDTLTHPGLRVQAQTETGVWRNLEHLPSDNVLTLVCGTGYEPELIPAKSCILFPVRLYRGPRQVRMRVVFEPYASVPFFGSVYSQQFENPYQVPNPPD